MDFPTQLKLVESPEPPDLSEVEGLSFVYILHSQDGSFYVGQTHDVRACLALHSKGTGARHTGLSKEFELVYFEGPLNPSDAVKRELQLKKWTKAKELALVRGDFEKLKYLS